MKRFLIIVSLVCLLARDLSFAYDLAGNRFSQNIDGQVTNYTYNNLDQLLTTGSTQYQYDPRGNLTSAVSAAGTIQYGFDAQDRLTSVTLPGWFRVPFSRLEEAMVKL